MWMFSLLFAYMNGISECLFNCYFLWIENMCMFFIACQSESNLWIFSLLFADMCFGGGDLRYCVRSVGKIAPSFVAFPKYRNYVSCFWLVNFYKSSSLSLLPQMNWHLAGSINGKSSI
jgi:hypothetical protein